MSKDHPVRLKDVAVAAGVSVSAVSKALQGNSELRPETAERIIRVAAQIGYYPNAAARSLRLGKTSRIGVILPNFTNAYSGILRGCEETAKKFGYTTVVLNYDDDETLEFERINTLISMPVDGILAVPANIRLYRDKPIPTVFISRYPYRPVKETAKESHDDLRRDHCVISDDFEGQRIATEHLLKCRGANNYIMLGTRNTNSAAGIKNYIRLDGYKKGLSDAGIPYDEDRVIMDVDTIEEGYNAALELCRRAAPPFGVALTNDLVSAGVLRALAEIGLRVPEDVCVVGYDDIDICAYYNPPLTTVHCTKTTIGTYAVQQILNIIGAPGGDSGVKMVLQPHLVLRSSTVEP